MDFTFTRGSKEDKGEILDLSLKTLKKAEGKLCPHLGQPTYNSFDKKWGLKFKGDPESNPARFDFIRENIKTFLNTMLNNIFCCHSFMVISNCNSDKPIIELLEKPNSDYFNNNNRFNVMGAIGVIITLYY